MKLKLFFIIVCLFIIGCSNAVTPREFEEAERRCEPHGGLEIYYNYNFPEISGDDWIGDCHCNDGLIIEGSAPEWNEVK